MDRPVLQADIAVGIISYERGALTRRCIESLDATCGTSLHLVVVDNGSTEAEALRLLDELERRPNTTVARLGKNLGPSAGRNVILARLPVTTDAIAFADNDILFLPGWDEAARGAFAAGWDVVQPKLLDADARRIERGPTRSWPEEYLLHPQYVGRGGDRNAPEVSERVEVETFAGSSIVGMQVFRKIGGFDDRIWAGEDYDVALRARAAGFRFVYEPRCEWIHDHVYVPDYDRQRSDIRRALASHVVLWQKHRKLLLDPSQLWLWPRLLERDEPLFLERSMTPKALFRRIRRKVVARLVNRTQWKSAEEGERATANAERVLRGA